MPYRAIEQLVQAFQVNDIKNIDFVFMGYPASTEAGRKSFDMILKKDKELDNFHYQSAVGSDKLINFTSSADLGFV